MRSRDWASDGPLTKPQVVTRGFRLGLATFLPMLPIYVVFFILSTAVQIWFFPSALPTAPDQTAQLSNPFGAAFIAVNLLLIAITIWGFAVLMCLVTDRAVGRIRSYPDMLYQGIRRLISVGIAYFVSGFITMIGFIFLIVPGLYFGVRLSLCSLAAARDGTGPLAAIGESWRLTRGRWWHSAFVLGLGFLPILAYMGVITIWDIVHAAGSSPASASNVVEPVSPLSIVSLIDSAAFMLTTHLTMGVSALLYWNLTQLAQTPRKRPSQAS